jgi:hypothetical protein
MNKLTPLVDSDFLIYRIGFAVKDDEPLEYALATAKQAVHNIWERFGKEGKLFLTGKNNFRDKIATIQTYKGNRDPANKPKYYTELREYLIKYQGAEVIDGMEAEDEVGILQYENKDKSTCIVGVDKDLDMIPGWHYNPVKETTVYIPIAEANETFWKQVLTGDRVDNILGIPGMGPKTAEKVVAPCKQEWVHLQDVVLQEYRKKFGNDAERQMIETAKLIWILRKRGITFDGSSIET